ncbi:hypothetical protein F5B22DRAFT_596809 [Xylaria bambusicola]|uniref:uncharacterized protein n=1 Tax=Xylaria bambusicola TaxID=326684 RepID=UPI002007F8B9|nr:uncharacterized protein F5B22DRAFT_596809 [Xylaria bambusicola]KAI0521432.1 hypothetical protein F5B22DRAFT_596809 [Xylaria bambusicola]
MADTHGQVRFLRRSDKWTTEKPFFMYSQPDRDEDPENVTNLEFQTQLLDITDIRGQEDDFKLEECGFKVVHHPPALVDFTTLEHIREYQKDVQSALATFFDAEHILVWDFKQRKTHRENSVWNLNNQLEIDTTIKEAHNDYTFVSGPIMIKNQLIKNDLERYLRPGYRFRMVNFWRSLLPVAEDQPLTLCDFRSIEPADVVACDRIRPDRSGESFYLHHNPNQKWYYLNSMTRDEAWVFVTYDSAAGNQARFCPHSSFLSPEKDISLTTRYSVETRAIVITKL